MKTKTPENPKFDLPSDELSRVPVKNSKTTAD
jgi:hypothetical protein